MISLRTFGQIVNTDEPGVKTFYPISTEACSPDSIFRIVENMPYYEGGLSELENDLIQSLDIDKTAQGTIYLSVYINCNAKAYAFQVLRGIEDKLDKQIIKQLEQLQNWHSGVQREKKVDCSLTLAITVEKGSIKVTD